MRAAAVVLILGAALWSPAASVAAGPVNPADFTELSLEELMAIPVYAASGYEQEAADAPSRVSVITREQIRAFGYRTIAEALAGQGGIFTSYDRQYTYVGVRGFAPPGDYNTRILLLLNGQRLNEELYSSPSLGTDGLVDIGLVERIEIVRGPGSSLYGSNAFLATVNVITRSGDDVAGGEVEGFAASHETFAGRLSYGRAFGVDGAVLVSGTLMRSAGQDLYFAAFDAPETNDGRAEGIDGTDAASLYLGAAAAGFEVQGAFKQRVKEVPTAPWETMFNEPGLELDERWFVGGLSWKGEVSGAGEVAARLFFQDYRYDGTYPYDWAEEGDEGPVKVRNLDYARSSSWGAELRFVTEALARNKLHAGLEFRDQFRLDQRTGDEGDAPYLDSRQDGEVYGAYLQDEIRLAGWAAVSVGLRYDRLEPMGAEELSPRVGLVVRPGPGTTVKVLYGEAFRSPNAYELYYDDGDVTQKASPGLSSESIRSYEAVLEQRLGNRLRATVAAYHWVIEDLVTQTVDPEDGLLVFENLDRAVADGLELELLGSLPGGVVASALYGYTDAEDDSSGERLVNSPRHLAALRARVPLAGERFLLAPEVRYLGERRTVGGGTVDDALLASLHLTVRAGARWEATAGVVNLFDTSYADPVGNEHEMDSIEQDGRIWRVAVTARF